MSTDLPLSIPFGLHAGGSDSEHEGARLIPNVSTTHLQYLVAVTRSRTFGDAAASLGVTQSALSQGISELEKRLGTRLFERQGRNRVLANDAREVVSWAEATLASTSDLVSHLQWTRGGSGGTLRVGLIDTAMMWTFAQAVADIHDELGSALRIDVGTTSQLIARVMAGELDAAVVVGGSTDELLAGNSCTSTVLFEEPLWVFATVDDTYHSPHAWVLPPTGSTTRTIIDAALDALGSDKRPRFETAMAAWSIAEVAMESHNPTVLAHMTAAGFGWTVLPADVASTFAERLRRPLNSPIATRPLVVIRRTAALPNPRLDRFVDRCEAAVDRPR